MENNLVPFHLAFPVKNLKDTKDFYTDILGCSLGRTNEKWIAGAGAVLSAGIAIVGLVAAVDAKTIPEVNKTTIESTRMCIS